MRDGPTSLSSWGLAIVAALESRGVDSRVLFEKSGLDVAALGDPNARYPLDATTRLWRLAVEATGDPAFGLEVARHTNFNTFQALGFSLATSGTLLEALERVVRFFAVVTNAADMSIETRTDQVRFAIHMRPGAVTADESVDAFLATTVRLCRALTRRRFNPLGVDMRRPSPKPDPTPFSRYFRVPVNFDAPLDVLTFDRASCSERLKSANPELARVNEAIAAEHLARLEQPSLRLRVRQWLLAELPRGEPSQEVIARRIGLGVRSMQRRLATEGTTYAALLDDLRRELALSYLQEGRYSSNEMTFLLGFSGASNFSRAFKRWTGQSPRNFRSSRRGTRPT